MSATPTHAEIEENAKTRNKLMITEKKVRREEKYEKIATTPITLNQTVAPVLSFFQAFFLKHQPFNEFFNVIQISFFNTEIYLTLKSKFDSMQGTWKNS